jgi:hypothetical protein
MRKKIEGSSVESGPILYATWTTSGPSEPIVLFDGRVKVALVNVSSRGLHSSLSRIGRTQASWPDPSADPSLRLIGAISAFFRDLIKTKCERRTEPGAGSSRRSEETRCRRSDSD